MRYLCLLLLISAVHVHAQITDIDFHLGISKAYENCVDFPSLKGYDSIAIVTELDHREFVARYRDKRLAKIAYLDTLNGYIMATKLYTFGHAGLLQEIEQRESYGYDIYKQIIASVQIKTMFKKIYEHDSLGRVKKTTHVYFNYLLNSYQTDSVFAEYKYSPGRLEIQTKEPYGRKLVVTFDDEGRIKSRVEYNRDQEAFSEWFFDYSEKRKIEVTFNLHRDPLDDIPLLPTPRSFKFVVTCDKKGLPIKFFDGKKILYFKYY
jgi:hypothetical protein